MTGSDHHWWARPDLDYQHDRLVFAGRDVEGLARQFGTPTFFYSASRLSANAARIHRALEKTSLNGRVRLHYAMKANRFAPLLTHLASTGLSGIDACSPNEVDHAIACGFEARDISFTAGSLSRDDIERLCRIDGLRINCDSLTAIRRIGERSPGRRIGIRINPAMGIGRAQNDKLQYSGGDTSKFGIYREQFAEAIALIKQFDLKLDTLHFHTGCGYLTPQLGIWAGILESAMWFVDQAGGALRSVNVGGGLGVPHVATDEALDLDQWASVLAKQFGPTGLEVEVEPGDYLMKDAGILLLSLTGIETKQTTVFAGVNAGFNIALEPAVYGLPFEPLPAIRRPGTPLRVTVHGNINEALDIFYHNIALPPLAEDDTLVLINAGAYSTSMASNHCMRGEFREFLLR